MAQTVPQLGARALRKIGYNVVPQSASPPDAVVWTQQTLATRALREQGIPIPEADRPAPLATVPVPELGARTIRAVGLNPKSVADASADATTYSQVALAGRVLRENGVIVPEASRPGPLATIPTAELGARTIRAVGLNPKSAADASADATTYTQLGLAGRVMRENGVITPEASRPGASAIVPLNTLADSTLRAAGVNPIAVADDTVDAATYTATQIGQRALRENGVIIAESSRPTISDVVTLADMGARTQRAAGLTPVAVADQSIPGVTTVDETEIGARALRMCGANPSGPVAAYAAGTEPTVTQAAIATQALQKLTVYDSGETPTTADLTLATQGVQQALELLTRLGIGSFPAVSTPNLPLRLEIPLVQMVAGILGVAFGKPQEPALFEAGLSGCWLQQLSGPDGQLRAVAAVQAVHDRVVALGYAGWAHTAIPQYATDSYVALVAAMLVPTFMGAGHGGGSTYVTSAQADAASSSARMQIVGAVDTAAAAALETLRIMALSGSYGLALAEAKVLAVHDNMVAQGFVSFSITAVPAAQAEDYVTMAAALFAVDVERDRPAPARQMDQAASDAAAGRVRRAAQVAGGQALAETVVATIHGELCATNLVTWPISTIPEAVADIYVLLTANALAPSFEGKRSPETHELGVRRVRQIALSGAYGRAIAAAKITAVHDQLVALGFASWSLNAVPAAQAEDYVTMAAVLLAPDIDADRDAPHRQMDKDSWEGAVERTRRAAQLVGAYALAQDRIATVHGELDGLGLVTWTLDAVPADIADVYVQLASNAMAPSFDGKFSPEIYDLGIRRARLLALSGAYGQALAEAKITAVHDQLVALGFASWPITAVPAAQAEDYVTMAAVLLGPDIDADRDAPHRQMDKDAWDGAIERTRRAAQLVGAYALAQDRIATVHGELDGMGFVTWSIDTVPADIADVYVQLAANAMAASFDAKFSGEVYDLGIKRARLLALSGAYGQALAEAKISAVHDGMSSIGLISWPITAIPAARAEDYVELAAVLLAPAVGLGQDPPSRQVDQAARAAGEERFRRAAQVAGAQALAESRIATAHAEWVAGNLVTWTLATIPDAVADAYVQMAVNSMAGSFGGKFDPKVYEVATLRVRMVVMCGPTGQALAEQKVRAVHADLDARGRVLWSLFDIPDYAEEPLVQMAAYLLGEEFPGVPKWNPAWWADGEMRLARQTMLASAGRPVVGWYY